MRKSNNHKSSVKEIDWLNQHRFPKSDAFFMVLHFGLNRTRMTRIRRIFTDLFSYPLKPLLPGTHDVPAAQAQFAIDGKQYIVKSNTSRITVHGPLVVLAKTVDSTVAYISDQIMVTINVRNDGDKQAMVKITDDLPSKADILSGDLSWTAVLDKNESKSYTYIMKLNKAGELELPAAKANITYVQNSYNFTVSSRNLTVLVVESLDKKQIATSSPSIPART